MDTRDDKPSRHSRDLGGIGQPVVAARTERLLRRLHWGMACLVGALVALLTSSTTLLRFEGSSRLWPAVANVGVVLALLVGLMQWWAWRQAQLEWRGIRDVALAPWLVPSRIGAWLAALSGLVGALAAAGVVRSTGSNEVAHWAALAGALLLIAGVALACLEPIDPAGPRGHLPSVVVRNLHARRTPELTDPHADTLVLRRDGLGQA